MPPPHRLVTPQGDRQTDSPARSGRTTSGKDPRPPTTKETGGSGRSAATATLLFLTPFTTAFPPGRVRWHGGVRLGEVFLCLA